MAPNKQEYIDFIINAFDKGIIERKNVLSKFGKKWQISDRTFDRYFKIANKIHSDRQELVKKELERDSIAAAKERLKKAIMTKEERMEFLSEIISGKRKIMQKRPFWNQAEGKLQMIPVENEASAVERIKAIAELNKMEGDYAPTKQEIKVDNKGVAGFILED